MNGFSVLLPTLPEGEMRRMYGLDATFKHAFLENTFIIIRPGVKNWTSCLFLVVIENLVSRDKSERPVHVRLLRSNMRWAPKICVQYVPSFCYPCAELLDTSANPL